MIDLPTPVPHIEFILASTGISKGLQQTEGPQLVVRPEIEWGPVTLLGYWKNVDSPTANGEAGASLQVEQTLAGFEVTAAAAFKRSTGAPPSVDWEALELIATVGRGFGPVRARASLVYSPDDLGSTGRSFYWEGGLTYTLREGTRLSASLGRRERDRSPDYTSFNIGVTQTLWRGISADVRYYDTAQSELGEVYEGRFVASLRARF
jgi:uncharacterized protein (TIGR02001 family)